MIAIFKVGHCTSVIKCGWNTPQDAQVINNKPQKPFSIRLRLSNHLNWILFSAKQWYLNTLCFYLPHFNVSICKNYPHRNRIYDIPTTPICESNEYKISIFPFSNFSRCIGPHRKPKIACCPINRGIPAVSRLGNRIQHIGVHPKVVPHCTMVDARPNGALKIPMSPINSAITKFNSIPNVFEFRVNLFLIKWKKIECEKWIL